MDRSRLAAVIPCHNEAATLGPVVSRALAYATVLVVDDRSTDGSADLARSLGAEALPSSRPGYDGALDTGLRAALERGFAYVVTLDADGEHDPGKLADFIALFERGEALVCGVRPAPQRAAEHVAAWAGRALLGIHDPLCGMKGYARPVLEGYASSGAPLLVNMAPAVLWRRAGGAVANLPIDGERRVGRPRFGRVLKANWTILQAFAAALKLRPANA